MFKKLRRDENAGLEGLPLYLLIMVIIAAVGIAVVMGWMNMIEGPKQVKTIEHTPEFIIITNTSTSNTFSNTSIDLTVTVYDQDGNPLAGAEVLITGLGIVDQYDTAPSGTTDSDGKAVFQGLKITQTGITHPWIGSIKVEVSKQGYTSSTPVDISVKSKMV